MATYDPLPRFYDLEYEDFVEDEGLYVECARRSGGPVLDVGTGTGRIAFALAGAGHDVTGIDESPAMLERADRKRRAGPALPGRIEFVQARAEEFDGRGRFRLAVLALTTFGHFHTTADQLGALTNLRRCLAPGGLLVIDLPNPDPLDLAQGDGLTLLHWQKTDPETGRSVQKWLTSRTDRGAQMQTYSLTYDEFGADGIVHRTTVSMPVRYTYRFEAQLLLERAGFALEQVLGSYAGDEYASDSERMILVAEKTSEVNVKTSEVHAETSNV